MLTQLHNFLPCGILLIFFAPQVLISRWSSDEPTSTSHADSIPSHHMVTVAVFLCALFLNPLFPIFFYSIPLSFSAVADAAPSNVKYACANATYRALCIQTLSTYAGPCRTRGQLARAAVNVSLSHSIRVSAYLKHILTATRRHNRRERAAMRDCKGQILDSVDELRRTLAELKHLGIGDFQWHMSNVETWTSAAMTNAESCSDGLNEIGGEEEGEGKVRTVLKREIRNLSKITSNALYLINRLNARP